MARFLQSPGKIAASLFGAALLLGILAFGYQALFAQRSAPEVVFRTLKGESIATADLRGKVVLVNFWATSCVTCVKEMPAIVATHQKFRDRGFETIAVAMSYDRPDYVLQFTEKNALPFKVALDLKDEVARGFGDIRLTPTTFIIDKRGRIIKQYLGEPDFVQLHALIDAELSKPG